jgi:hypothetical protein
LKTLIIPKAFILFLFTLAITSIGCSSDNNDCPDSIIVDINDPESIAQAEACGLRPAEPLGTLWVSDNYINELKKRTEPQNQN